MFLGTLWSSIKEIKAPNMFYWEHGILCRLCRKIGPHLVASGKSHVFSRVAVGTWGIFSSYGGDDPSKLVIVQ